MPVNCSWMRLLELEAISRSQADFKPSGVPIFFDVSVNDYLGFWALGIQGRKLFTTPCFLVEEGLR